MNNAVNVINYLFTLEDSHDLNLDVRSDSINNGNASHAAAYHNHLEAFKALTESQKVSHYVKDASECTPFEILGKKAKGKNKEKRKAEEFRTYYMKLMDRLG
jgi:hypothetical protein